jgi:hypothetical protein
MIKTGYKSLKSWPIGVTREVVQKTNTGFSLGLLNCSNQKGKFK